MVTVEAAAALVRFIGESETVLADVLAPATAEAGADTAEAIVFSSRSEETEDELEEATAGPPDTPAEWYLGLGCLTPYTDLAFLTDSEVRLEDDARLPTAFWLLLEMRAT